MQPPTESAVPPTMSQPVAAALLKRSDAPLWRLYIADDWATFAGQLCQHHCFDVCPVLVAPSLQPGAQVRLEAAIQGMQLWRGWFKATPEQAMALLQQALPLTDEHVVSDPVRVMSATTEQATRTVSAEAVSARCLTAGDHVPVNAEDEHSASDASMEDSASNSDAAAECLEEEPIFQFCEPCVSRDATRSCEIRALLKDKFGKVAAKAILSKVTTTVAQDRQGKKIKVFKHGSSHLKVRM